jgi:hypothetical protein
MSLFNLQADHLVDARAHRIGQGEHRPVAQARICIVSQADIDQCVDRFLPLYRSWRNHPVQAITEFILIVQSGCSRLLKSQVRPVYMAINCLPGGVKVPYMLEFCI